jgi:cytochrome b561
MFALPLVGWTMLSAAGYPITLYGPWQLPPIAPRSPELFAALRTTHTVLALLLFATFLAHMAAALMHALIFRDGVFPSMTLPAFGSAEEPSISRTTGAEQRAPTARDRAAGSPRRPF